LTAHAGKALQSGRIRSIPLIRRISLIPAIYRAFRPRGWRRGPSRNARGVGIRGLANSESSFHRRKESRPSTCRSAPGGCSVGWIGGVSASLLPCHRCRTGTGSERVPADARSSSTAGALERAARTPAPVPKREPGCFVLTSVDRHTSANHPYGTRRRRSAAKSLLSGTRVPFRVPLRDDLGAE
jgi:hypothetical protein